MNDPVEEVMQKVQEVCKQFGTNLDNEASFLSELLAQLNAQYADVRDEIREQELRQKYTPTRGDL